ncbi:MAG: hypothetical protein Q4G63_04590 [Bacteroidia bacterium]|nr:hypothetical protein [Bacteroidia bacterium]
MSKQHPNIILYNTVDGKAQVTLYAHDGTVWLNQAQMAELFATSRANITLYAVNVLKDEELELNSVYKEYLHTANDGKVGQRVCFPLRRVRFVPLFSKNTDSFKQNLSNFW